MDLNSDFRSLIVVVVSKVVWLAHSLKKLMQLVLVSKFDFKEIEI